MKNVLVLIFSIFCLAAQGEELIVRVSQLPESAVLISKNRNIIPSVHYRISREQIIFTGKKSDIDFLKQVVSQKTLLPFFSDAYQALTPVNYTITFQIRDPLYLINLSTELNCRSSFIRYSQCGGFSYYSSPSCQMTGERRMKLEQALKVTSSLEDAKLLKVITDNPCVNPRTETLYDFALKNLSHRMATGDFDGKMELDYQAYLVNEEPLEIL
jgi:hypothetical protein